jgi:hypothetical protein
MQLRALASAVRTRDLQHCVYSRPWHVFKSNLLLCCSLLAGGKDAKGPWRLHSNRGYICEFITFDLFILSCLIIPCPRHWQIFLFAWKITTQYILVHTVIRSRGEKTRPCWSRRRRLVLSPRYQRSRVGNQGTDWGGGGGETMCWKRTAQESCEKRCNKETTLDSDQIKVTLPWTKKQVLKHPPFVWCIWGFRGVRCTVHVVGPLPQLFLRC